jgi:putative glycosyltransferase (TIGR04372 family)
VARSSAFCNPLQQLSLSVAGERTASDAGVEGIILKSSFGHYLGAAACRLVAFVIRRLDCRLLEISHPDRVGHLCMEPDCYLKEVILDGGKPKRIFLLKTAVGFSNEAIVAHLSRYINVIQDPRLTRILSYSFKVAGAVVQTQSYASAMYQTARCFDVYRRWGGRAPLFQLSAEDKEFGEATLRRMGIPAGAWFVCVHAREGGYSPGDEALHSFRSVNIEDYTLAIEEITARGGWCIRMGDATMRSIEPRDRVVDYARSTFKSDRMDVFLAASCRFFLGSSSGVHYIATIFGRPGAIANTAPLACAYVPGIDDLATPQRLRLADGRMPTFEEIMASDIANCRLTSEFDSRGAALIKVSPQEIRSLAFELMDRLDGKAIYSQEDEVRQVRFRALFREGHYAYKAGSRIGRDYLSKHFTRSDSARATSPPAASSERPSALTTASRPEIA